MRQQKLKPCPFCGGTTLAIILVPSIGIGVVCENVRCGIKGPKSSSTQAAIRRWNRRTQGKEKGKS